MLRIASTAALTSAASAASRCCRPALASAAVLAILSIDIVVSQFPRGLIVLACLVIAFAAAWYGLTRTGGARLWDLESRSWRWR